MAAGLVGVVCGGRSSDGPLPSGREQAARRRAAEREHPAGARGGAAGAARWVRDGSGSGSRPRAVAWAPGGGGARGGAGVRAVAVAGACVGK